RSLVCDETDLEITVGKHAELAGIKGRVKFGRPRASNRLGHQPLSPHLVQDFEHTFDVAVPQGLVVGRGWHDVSSRRPHHRSNSENIASTAVTGNVVAVDVGTESPDLFGVFVDFLHRGRALFRVKSSLAK